MNVSRAAIPNPEQESPMWTRRGFLGLAAGVGAGALLAACGADGSKPGGVESSAGETLPKAEFIVDERAIDVSNIVVPGMGLDQLALPVAQARKAAERQLAGRVRSAVLHPEALPSGFRVITYDHYSNQKFDHTFYGVVNDTPMVEGKRVPGYMWVTGYGVRPQGKLLYVVAAAMPTTRDMNDIVYGLSDWNSVVLATKNGSDADHVCLTLQNYGVESVTNKPYWPEPQPSSAPDVARTPEALEDLQRRQARLLAPMYFNAPPVLSQ